MMLDANFDFSGAFKNDIVLLRKAHGVSGPFKLSVNSFILSSIINLLMLLFFSCLCHNFSVQLISRALDARIRSVGDKPEIKVCKQPYLYLCKNVLLLEWVNNRS